MSGREDNHVFSAAQKKRKGHFTIYVQEGRENERVEGRNTSSFGRKKKRERRTGLYFFIRAIRREEKKD